MTSQKCQEIQFKRDYEILEPLEMEDRWQSWGHSDHMQPQMFLGWLHFSVGKISSMWINLFCKISFFKLLCNLMLTELHIQMHKTQANGLKTLSTALILSPAKQYQSSTSSIVSVVFSAWLVSENNRPGGGRLDNGDILFTGEKTQYSVQVVLDDLRPSTTPTCQSAIHR